MRNISEILGWIMNLVIPWVIVIKFYRKYKQSDEDLNQLYDGVSAFLPEKTPESLADLRRNFKKNFIFSLIFSSIVTLLLLIHILRRYL